MIPTSLQQQLLAQRQQGKKIVLVTGVFDLLHQEHRIFLQKAKQLGAFLVVAIESDVRVKQLKGEDRPIWNQDRRLQALQEVESVDAVLILPDDFSKPEHHRQLISEIRPDMLAVSEHSPNLDKKKAILAEFGGEVVVAHDHNPAISTSRIISEQLSNQQTT